MKTKDMPEFVKILSGLMEVLIKRDELTELGIELYYETLKQYDIEQIRNAAYFLLKHNKFFPTISEFTAVLEDNKDSRSLLEAHIVLVAVRKVGGYKSVVFEDPVTTAVIKSLGGWTYVCKEKADNRTWFIREFQKLYLSFSENGMVDCSRLPGIMELQNGSVRDSDIVHVKRVSPIGMAQIPENTGGNNPEKKLKPLLDGIGDIPL